MPTATMFDRLNSPVALFNASNSAPLLNIKKARYNAGSFYLLGYKPQNVGYHSNTYDLLPTRRSHLFLLWTFCEH